MSTENQTTDPMHRIAARIAGLVRGNAATERGALNAWSRMSPADKERWLSLAAVCQRVVCEDIVRRLQKESANHGW